MSKGSTEGAGIETRFSPLALATSACQLRLSRSGEASNSARRCWRLVDLTPRKPATTTTNPIRNKSANLVLIGLPLAMVLTNGSFFGWLILRTQNDAVGCKKRSLGRNFLEPQNRYIEISLS